MTTLLATPRNSSTKYDVAVASVAAGLALRFAFARSSPQKRLT